MMSLTHPPRRRGRPTYGSLSSRAIAIAIGLLAAPVVHAAPAGDDWSLERTQSDPTLVAQRFGKLKRNPFDGKQWSALVRALGVGGLAKKIRGALSSAPSDVSLRILEARATLAQGHASKAAEKLAALGPEAGRFEASVFKLRIEALESAHDFKGAATALERRSESHTGAARTALLERAFGFADRSNRSEDALRLAQKLAALSPDDSEAHLRLARAARGAGQGAAADRAYADAIAKSRRGADELVAERASARVEADNPTGATELLWSLLEDPHRGSKAQREPWWEKLGAAHRRGRSTDVLIERLGKWLRKHDKEAAAWRVLAQAQESMGVDPSKSLVRALELSPRDADTHVQLIETLEYRGESKAAVDEFLELLARSPKEIGAGLELASRLIASGEHELGMGLAAEIEKSIGRRAHGLMLLLDFYNLNDEPERALQIAIRLVKAHPRKAEARIALGEQLYQMNRTKEALEQWARLPKLIRPAHKGFARHAQVLSEHDRTAEAVLSLKKAIKIAPREPNYLRLRAVLAEEQRRPNQALELWEQVRQTATDPTQKLLRDEARTRVVELLVGGSIPKRRFKLDRAVADAQVVLDKGEPRADAIEAGRFLSELHTRRENYSAAVAVQHRMLELRPDDPQRLEDLASAQRRAGQVKSAMGTLEELLDAEPGRQADVLAEMSELAFEAGDDDKALKTATRAAKTDRTQVEALVRLGELHERRGDLEAAASAYERALATAPADPRARLRLAELELTRGQADRAAALLREVLDHGGPPELLREAGRRALDLAEVSGSLGELLDLAVKRTGRHPEADEPREFLLEALDRVGPRDVGRWLSGDGPKGSRDDRERALRRPLVASLTRGSIGARLRAAEHLGGLALPETAVPLAKMGAGLAAPRDATLTVREAFERARLTAIRAAGELRDPEATPLFIALVDDGRQSLPARQAAAWALARGGSREGAEALAPRMRTGADHQLAAWACLALAGQPRGEVDLGHASAAGTLARESNHPTVRHACAYAEAALTSDANVAQLRAQLRASDPTLAAVAAWRMGRSRPTRGQADAETIEALLARFIGAGGLARDAASASLAALLGDADSDADDDDAHAEPPAPVAPSGSAWATTIERWLQRRIAPDFDALDVSDLAPHDAALRRALRAAQSGTRAERAAAERMLRECGAESDARSVCLSPLVKGPYRLAQGVD